MRIAVLGTGVVGRTLAAGLATIGHEVSLGTRDPGASAARTEPDRYGVALSVWIAGHPDIRLATFADAAAGSDVIVNASAGLASIDMLTSAGAANLDGKVLIDVANPLDFSRGMPPAVAASSEDSLAERIQAAFPNARVVKTLNTMTAALMVDPGSLAGGDHTVFVSGDDGGAKATVSELLHALGWHDIVDLGDLTSARGAELLLPIWLSLVRSLGLPAQRIQVKVVRGEDPAAG